ncbi:putative RNA recognition motif domain, nucleotide-binding alpha-beta plait domain superfamily [Helianthus annuus]|nr:putative RNA recognition motif domain, nucleotide-binding alpha-beta plait domain superfamily [Helianthus annuus]KAJ0758892.1 putative RNA recognition motif domain, nucleotide-binding alpha-beta plait domain superfamily [Helianthus annuus]KAJ0762542.1 putative RNA recognition motif domain, nucleotide-binding alpha-beta plait domain superfamily [Helianthus annuus]KAJ0797614.1 putative RNA recognition motif domain, nucleotide-binding alpha-beta plait domain superfamily [Helianthus annuus]KAJ09
MMSEGGGEPGDGGPWSEVQYRKNTRGRGDGIEWTFLVQNLADKVTRNVLWRAFKPFGFVSDAYVARKRDSKGKCFGFVRYVGVVNMKETLASMNTVKMFDMKVTVSLAKYDKDHKKIQYAPDLLGRNTWRPKEGQQVHQKPADGNRYDGYPPSDNHRPKHGPASVHDGRSYADILKGNSSGNNNGAKVITVGGKGSLYPLHCIGRSVLGLAKEVMSICELRQSIEEVGMNEVGLSYVGGISFLLTFRDKASANICLGLHEEFFKSVFSQYKIWNGEDIPYSRLVNLSVNGVPFIIRDDSLFNEIGSKFGEVVKKSSFSWQEEDNSRGSALIVTSIPSRIEEAVVLKWNNKTIVCWVSESSWQWTQGVEDSSFTGSQDSESDLGSDSDEESVEMDVLEEGEIDQKLGNSDHRKDDDMANGRQENDPVEDDQVVDNQQTEGNQGSAPINVVENVNDMHGDSVGAVHDIGVNAVLSRGLRDDSNDSNGGPNINHQSNNKVGPNAEVVNKGPSLGPNLGKRNRDVRSPPSVGSTQGPTQRLFNPSSGTHIESIDLNTW